MAQVVVLVVPCVIAFQAFGPLGIGHLQGAGLRELPPKRFINFGRLARDCGVQPIGLPRVEILHVPW